MQRLESETSLHSVLVKALSNNDLAFIKDYCENGKNKEKFLQVMTLGMTEKDFKNENLKGLSAIYVAAKNASHSIVEFLITEAMLDADSKRMLRDHLQIKNAEGRNALHVAAFTPENHQSIKLLCETGDKLEIKNYVNLRDTYYNRTALHFTVVQVNQSNYAALIEAKADASITDERKHTAIDLVNFNDNPTKKVAFMKYLFESTHEGEKYLSHWQKETKNFSDDTQHLLIELEMLTKIDETDAQLKAFELYVHLYKKIYTDIEDKKDTHDIIVKSLELIQFQKISISDFTGNNMSDPLQYLKKIIEFADHFKVDDLRNYFILANILSNIKFRKAQLGAMNLFALLLQPFPLLAQLGFKRLLEKNPKDFLLQQLYVNSRINAIIKDYPPMNFFDKLFGKSHDEQFQILKDFLTSVNKVSSIEELHRLIRKDLQKIPPLQSDLSTILRIPQDELKSDMSVHQKYGGNVVSV